MSNKKLKQQRDHRFPGTKRTLSLLDSLRDVTCDGGAGRPTQVGSSHGTIMGTPVLCSGRGGFTSSENFTSRSDGYYSGGYFWGNDGNQTKV